MTTSEEFLNVYRSIKIEYNLVVCKINLLKKNDKQEDKTAEWQECLRLINAIFDKPLNLPAKLNGLQKEWKEISEMTEHLDKLKLEIMKRLKMDTTTTTTTIASTKLGGKRRFIGAVLVVASTAMLNYMTPGITGEITRRLGSATMTVGRKVVPYSGQILKKSIQYYAKQPAENNKTNPLSSTITNVMTIATGAAGTFRAIQSGVNFFKGLCPQLKKKTMT